MMFLAFLFTLIIGFCLGIFVFYRWPNRFTKFIQSLKELFKKESEETSSALEEKDSLE